MDEQLSSGQQGYRSNVPAGTQPRPSHPNQADYGMLNLSTGNSRFGDDEEAMADDSSEHFHDDYDDDERMFGDLEMDLPDENDDDAEDHDGLMQTETDRQSHHYNAVKIASPETEPDRESFKEENAADPTTSDTSQMPSNLSDNRMPDLAVRDEKCIPDIASDAEYPKLEAEDVLPEHDSKPYPTADSPRSSGGEQKLEHEGECKEACPAEESQEDEEEEEVEEEEMEEVEEEGIEGGDGMEEVGSLLTAKQKAHHAITGRGVTLAMLMADEIVQPGDRTMSIDYLVGDFFATFNFVNIYTCIYLKGNREIIQVLDIYNSMYNNIKYCSNCYHVCLFFVSDSRAIGKNTGTKMLHK